MAAGLAKALKKKQETKNMTVFLGDFASTQKQLLAAIENIQGVEYATEAIQTRFTTGRCGGPLGKEPGEI
ncbi:hypothetical protein F4818DRAFT_446174 [Hypoxylon cercidicola]|nr:hypothetical protein F4818DRAFT_446174 [Hypoxylon cercidicola]